MNALKKKNGIKLEGRTDQGYLWAASPHTKRMTVKIWALHKNKIFDLLKKIIFL